jgi:hypothetical protein
MSRALRLEHDPVHALHEILRQLGAFSQLRAIWKGTFRMESILRGNNQEE